MGDPPSVDDVLQFMISICPFRHMFFHCQTGLAEDQSNDDYLVISWHFSDFGHWYPFLEKHLLALFAQGMTMLGWPGKIMCWYCSVASCWSFFLSQTLGYAGSLSYIYLWVPKNGVVYTCLYCTKKHVTLPFNLWSQVWTCWPILKKQHHIKSGGWMLTQIFLMKHPYVCWLERETHVYPKLTNTDVEHQWFPWKNDLRMVDVHGFS